MAILSAAVKLPKPKVIVTQENESLCFQASTPADFLQPQCLKYKFTYIKCNEKVRWWCCALLLIHVKYHLQQVINKHFTTAHIKLIGHILDILFYVVFTCCLMINAFKIYEYMQHNAMHQEPRVIFTLSIRMKQKWDHCDLIYCMILGVTVLLGFSYTTVSRVVSKVAESCKGQGVSTDKNSQLCNVVFFNHFV